MQQNEVLFQPLELPCGVVLKNRIAKSARKFAPQFNSPNRVPKLCPLINKIKIWDSRLE